LLKLLKKRRANLFVEIETNGTKVPSEALSQLVDQFNVSPKLRNSGTNYEVATNPQALRYFAVNPNAYFKFVVVSVAEITPILDLVEYYSIAKTHVFLMPEGRTSEALNQKMEALSELAGTEGVRVTDRAHIHSFGDERGT